MSKAWLDIPLADYEGHMASVEVRQLVALSDIFAGILIQYEPSSLAILGVAGGNGLERIDDTVTKRIVGVDINPQYLEEVRRRFAGLPGLELHCIDLAAKRMDVQPVDLLHAALVFEHAGVGLCLENALALVAPGGIFSTVLQRPSELAEGVSQTPFASLQKLKSTFSMIEPQWLEAELGKNNFQLIDSASCLLPAGKSFWSGQFRREG